MVENDPVLRNMYLWMAAVAGAVTALSMQRWKSMSFPEVLMALFVGTSFALFVAPYVAHEILGVPFDQSRTVACITYVFAISANVIIPVVVKGMKGFTAKWFGIKSDEGEAE